VIATDGVVTLRAPGPGDAELLVAGRDELIHPANERSLAVAHRLGFTQVADVNGESFFTRDLR
jgi:hypothetical protein